MPTEPDPIIAVRKLAFDLADEGLFTGWPALAEALRLAGGSQIVILRLAGDRWTRISLQNRMRIAWRHRPGA